MCMFFIHKQKDNSLDHKMTEKIRKIPEEMNVLLKVLNFLCITDQLVNATTVNIYFQHVI